MPSSTPIILVSLRNGAVEATCSIRTVFHGQEFGHRTYFEHGRSYDRFYGRYPYHGRYLEVLRAGSLLPLRILHVRLLSMGHPGAVRLGLRRGSVVRILWRVLCPYPVYAGPTFWLTDFILASSLQAAYAAQSADANQAQSTVAQANYTAPAALTPETKQMIADEVRLQLQQESVQAQANASKQDVDTGNSSIVHLLSDNQPHVFVVGSNLDVVTASGQECGCSQDVLRVTSTPPQSSDTASATMLASKGGTRECSAGDTVVVAMTDLQDMDNHMRETIDDGLSELQSKQGKNGLPAAPPSAVGAPTQAAFVAGAPPPDTNAGSEISQQSTEAAQAEQEASASAPTASPAATSGPSVTIALGQTTDQVTAALGNPPRIIDLGAKKIYTYPDMKIIFQNGKVSDVQ